jgi:hypothetical protein
MAVLLYTFGVEPSKVYVGYLRTRYMRTWVVDCDGNISGPCGHTWGMALNETKVLLLNFVHIICWMQVYLSRVILVP